MPAIGTMEPEVATAEVEKFARWCRKHLRLSNGKPLIIEGFQKKALADYFAGVRELVIIIPKKNGKTTLLAALALYHLLHTEDPDVVICASSSKQAMKLFDEARGFVKRSAYLESKLRVLRGYKEIRVRDPKNPNSPKEFAGIAAVLAADEDTADGWGGTLALVDELHRHKSGGLYGILLDGLGPRAGQLVTISTAGEDEESPLGELRSKAYAMENLTVRGAYRYVTNGAFSLHEWALEPGQNTEDIDLVKEANPASWQTPEELSRRRNSPSMTPFRWARFACGIWGLGGEPAFDRKEDWDPLEREGARIEPGANVTVGFDGARRKDGTGIVICDIASGLLVPMGYWEKPADADADWEVPEEEVSEIVEYIFDTFEVALFYADPPFWESTIDEWAGKYGLKKVVRWWTNRIKATAIALRAFKNDMRPEEMGHDGDPKLAEHIGNAIRQDTKMEDNGETLWVIRKESRHSPRKIDLAMAAVLAWKARGDAISTGLLNKPKYSRAVF